MSADINHTIGGDLAIGPTGDILLVTGPAFGQQRVLRRLLTNPLDYIWHLEYGGGLATMIGTPSDAPAIRGIIRSQLAKEAAVSPDPPAAITVTATDAGVVSAAIQYADATTGATQVLNLPT